MTRLFFTDLPNPTVYMTQDGGCFYFTNFPGDERWDIEDHNPLVMYFDTGIDPSFDQIDLCERLRRETIAYMATNGFTVIWDI
jgi:hypothetical protein